jgi:CRP/FNR family cyclic AMP-dependent transcriptional regulator
LIEVAAALADRFLSLDLPCVSAIPACRRGCGYVAGELNGVGRNDWSVLSVPLRQSLFCFEHVVPGEQRYRCQMGKSAHLFDVQAFLDSAGLSKKILEFGPAEVIFSRGDCADGVMCVQKGEVKLSVRSKAGREAVVSMLDPGDFFGEGCLAGEPLRIDSATTITPSRILVIQKDHMRKMLHRQPSLSDRFLSNTLARMVRLEQNLIGQLVNSSENRLARALLLLARRDERDKPRQWVPKISQEMLSEMVGTTRSRVNFFMNKFKRLGFIDYNGDLDAGIQINRSLLRIVSHD